MQDEPNSTPQQDNDAKTYFGKDCPKGMVQVEFVGCYPAEKYSEYGWKPAARAFIEIYIDGQRFRIDIGTFHDGRAERRGLHIISDVEMYCEPTAANACSVWLKP